MPRDRNALKAGLFIIICVAVALAIVVAVQGTSFQTMQTRTVSFNLKDNLSGLRVGDEVRIGGFKVGEVRTIEIVPSNDPRLEKRAKAMTDQAAILVTFTMPSRYEVRDDTLIGIETTVTEKTCLNISRMGTGKVIGTEVNLVGHPSSLSAAMESLAEIVPRVGNILTKVETETVPAIDGALADVRGKTLPNVSKMLESFRATAESATALIKTVQEQVKPIVGKYTAVAESAGKALDNIADVAGQKDSDTDLRGTLKNLRAITQSIEKKLPGILDDVQTTIKGVNSAVDTTKQIVGNIKDMSVSAKSIISGNEARLHSMVRHLNQTADNMQGFSEELRSRPWRLLYTPKRDEIYNLALFQSARDFAQGASDLNEATQALQDAIKDKRSNPEQIKGLVDKVQDQFGKFQVVEKKLWDSVK